MFSQYLKRQWSFDVDSEETVVKVQTESSYPGQKRNLNKTTKKCSQGGEFVGAMLKPVLGVLGGLLGSLVQYFVSMEYTKKMILVDPRTLDTIRTSSAAQASVLDAATESLRDMDQQMRDVLDRNDMNLKDKANLYQQTLWRYLKRFGQYKDKQLGTVLVIPDEWNRAVVSTMC